MSVSGVIARVSSLARSGWKIMPGLVFHGTHPNVVIVLSHAVVTMQLTGCCLGVSSFLSLLLYQNNCI